MVSPFKKDKQWAVILYIMSVMVVFADLKSEFSVGGEGWTIENERMA